MKDILVVGAGPAGLSAGIYAVRAGHSCTVFDNNAYGGQMAQTNEISNYPGTGTTDGVSLATNMYNQAIEHGVEVVFEQVTSLELTAKTKSVTTTSGKHMGKAVIYAAGSARRKLEVPGEDKFLGRGVSYCATCDGAFFKGKDTAIVGGGSAALEDALFLSNVCRKVYLIHRRDEFRGEDILQKAVKSKKNIEILYFSTVQSISGSSSVEQISLLVNGAEKTISVSGVFVAIGLIPRTELLGGAIALSESGYCDVDGNCRTDLPGVFVAGDVRKKPLRQIVTAAADGAVAAVAAASYCAGIDADK